MKETPSPETGYVRGLRLHIGPRGKAYYYQFKLAGEVYHGSTDTANEKAAIAFLEALKTELREKQKRQELGRLSLPTLAKVYDEWVEEMEPHASVGHMKSVKSYWVRHIEPTLGALRLNQISTALVEKCRATYLEDGGTPGGANSLLIALNALFGWAIRHRVIAAKPYTVKKLKVQRKPRPVLPGELTPKFLTSIDRAENPHVRELPQAPKAQKCRGPHVSRRRWGAPQGRLHTEVGGEGLESCRPEIDSTQSKGNICNTSQRCWHSSIRGPANAAA